MPRIQVIDLKKDSDADVYFQINLSGRVFVSIKAIPGVEPCANFWWINWPFGTVRQEGRHCNFVAFDIPGWRSLSVSSKLRAGGAAGDLKLGVSADEAVARQFTAEF